MHQIFMKCSLLTQPAHLTITTTKTTTTTTRTTAISKSNITEHNVTLHEVSANVLKVLCIKDTCDWPQPKYFSHGERICSKHHVSNLKLSQYQISPPLTNEGYSGCIIIQAVNYKKR